MFFDHFRKNRVDSRTDLYRKIAISFFSISAIIAIVIFAVSFSWATVTITPTVKPLSDTVSLTIQDEPVTTVGALSGKTVEQDLGGTGTFTPSAVSTIQEKVSGVITVVNTSGHAQQLRASTRFLSQAAVLFRSNAFVSVPAHGQIDVSVVADAVGDPGDISHDRFSIPGLHPEAQKQIYGVSFIKGVGGAQEVRTITTEDVSRGVDEVSKKLQEKFKLLLDTEKTKVSAPSVSSTLSSEVTTTTLDHQVGDQAKEFTVRLKMHFTAVMYDEQKVLAAIQQALMQNLSSGYQLIAPALSDIAGTIMSVDPTSHLATLSFKVAAGKIRNDDLQPFHKKDLAGLSRDDIVAYFRGYDDITNVTVSFYPFWVTRAPLLVDHIAIRIAK